MGRQLSVTENVVQRGFKAIKVYLLGGDGKHRAKAPLLVPLGAKEAYGRIEEEGSLIRCASLDVFSRRTQATS